MSYVSLLFRGYSSFIGISGHISQFVWIQQLFSSVNKINHYSETIPMHMVEISKRFKWYV